MMASSFGVLTATAASASTLDEALVKAAEQGDVERVRDLLRRGADPNYKNKDGITALLWAASACNHNFTVRLLLDEVRITMIETDWPDGAHARCAGPVD